MMVRICEKPGSEFVEDSFYTNKELERIIIKDEKVLILVNYVNRHGNKTQKEHEINLSDIKQVEIYNKNDEKILEK